MYIFKYKILSLISLLFILTIYSDITFAQLSEDKKPVTENNKIIKTKTDKKNVNSENKNKENTSKTQATKEKKEESSDIKNTDKKNNTKKSSATDEKKDKADDKATVKENEDLAKEEKKGKWIETTLDFGLDDDRKDAINRIKLIKNESIKKRLLSKLVDLLKIETNPEIKVKAITIAGELEAKNAVPAITEKLDDESEDVRTAAAYGLKDLKGISAKQKLIEKLKTQDISTDSNFTIALIHVLGDFKATELIKFSTDSINDHKTTKNTREALVIFMGKLGSNEPKDFLINLYKDDEEEIIIRSYAVNSLAKLGIKEATKDIKEIIKMIDSYPFKKRKKYYKLRIYSIAALVKLGDKDSTPLLMNSLKSNNPGIRLKAIQLLKEIKDKRTIDILKYKIKYDPDKKVRKAAEEALKEIDVVETKETVDPEKKDIIKNNPK